MPFPTVAALSQQELPANEQQRPQRVSIKIIRKSTSRGSRGSRGRRDKERVVLNSRSVAKLMDIKMKIRGEKTQRVKPEVMIDNKRVSRVFDELNEQRI